MRSNTQAPDLPLKKNSFTSKITAACASCCCASSCRTMSELSLTMQNVQIDKNGRMLTNANLKMLQDASINTTRCLHHWGTSYPTKTRFYRHTSNNSSTYLRPSQKRSVTQHGFYASHGFRRWSIVWFAVFDRSVVACWFAMPWTAVDTASLATWFLFDKLFGLTTLVGFGEKRCRKNLPLAAAR